MADEKSDNIFNIAGKKASGKPAPQTPATKSPEQKPLTDEEARESIRKMLGESEALAVRLDELYKRTGWSPAKVKKIFDQQKFVENEIWRDVQLKRKEEEAKVDELRIRIGARDTHAADDAKRRKGKILGRRKGWIGM